MGEKDREIINVKDNNTQQFDEIFETEVSYAPLVDIYETSDNFVLIANMPGVSRDNISLKIQDNALVIFGKINYKEAVNRKYILNENEVGNYFRKFRISESIDESKIEAKFENGQLEVILPKHERVKPRKINIS